MKVSTNASKQVLDRWGATGHLVITKLLHYFQCFQRYVRKIIEHQHFIVKEYSVSDVFDVQHVSTSDMTWPTLHIQSVFGFWRVWCSTCVSIWHDMTQMCVVKFNYFEFLQQIRNKITIRYVKVKIGNVNRKWKYEINFSQTNLQSVKRMTIVEKWYGLAFYKVKATG